MQIVTKREQGWLFILEKIDFKSKTIIRDTGKHYMMIKGSIHQKDIIINIYAPNSRAPKYMEQILTEPNGETDSNIIIIDFSTLLSIKHRSSRQKINKERDLNKLDLTDIYNIPSNNRIHILLKYTKNVLQNHMFGQKQVFFFFL